MSLATSKKFKSSHMLNAKNVTLTATVLDAALHRAYNISRHAKKKTRLCVIWLTPYKEYEHVRTACRSLLRRAAAQASKLSFQPHDREHLGYGTHWKLQACLTFDKLKTTSQMLLLKLQKLSLQLHDRSLVEKTKNIGLLQQTTAHTGNTSMSPHPMGEKQRTSWLHQHTTAHTLRFEPRF